ncbi:hypothetical protein Tco_1142402 [Tanacetum coccineum]
MDITKAEQIALDDALVAPANRLKIGKCNLRLSSDLKSKEATLQVVYDVLKLTPFYKAFQASADVPEIYMQEFWATASVHNRSIRFKMNNKKHIVNLEYFREMLQICPKIYPSIPQRNKINWHYARDDPMFTTINVISRHEDIQLYGKILPKELTNEDIRNSESYKEYYAIASGKVPQKTKASVHKKKADSDTTPKEKPPTDPKDKRVKQTGKMTGSRKQKQPAIGLETLSEIALTETEQLKIAIKRSRIQTHNSQASGSGDGVDILSKVSDEQVYEKTGTDEGAGDKLEVLDVPEHHSNSEEESWTFSDDADANKDSDAHDDDDDDATESDDDSDNITHPKLSTFSTDDQEEQDDEEEQEEDDEDEEEISDQLVRTPSDYQTTDESEKQKDDDRVKDGEEDKERDMTNVNLEGATNPVVHQQSSSVSDLVSKFISPTTDEGIESILTPYTKSTTLVNVPIFVATETPATTTTIPDLFFFFNQRVTALESDLSKLKQSNPFVEAISSIPSIVNEYLCSKMKEAVDVAIQLKSIKLREEAQAENQEFLNSLDSNMQKIIKDQVKTQTSKIKSKVKKYVTESLGAEVLIRSTNQPQTSYGIASSLSELELKRILMDKIEENKSIDRSDTTHLEFITGDDDVIPAREVHAERQWHPPTFTTPDRTQSSFDEFMATPIDFSAFMKNRLKIDHLTQELLTGPTYDLIKGTCKSVAELEYHLEEVFKATNEQLDWNNPEGTPYPHNLSHVKWIEDRIPRTTWSVVPIDYDKHAYWGTYHWGPKRQRFYGYATNMETSKDVYSRNMIIEVISLKIMKFFGYSHLEEITVRRQDDVLYKFREGDFKRLCRQDIEDMLLLLVQGKLTNLSLDDRYVLNVALRMYTQRIVIQERVEDLQLAIKSYQKKINLTRPDTTRPDLRKMTPYTGYPDVQGIIYQDELSRNRLMRTDELYKFSDGILNHVRTTLNDIATGIQMDYLPKRRRSPQDKRRARVMISAINRKLRDQRLMRNLEKFVGGRPFYTSAGNPVKEILLKLNLPDHRILKDGGEDFRYSDTERLSRSDEVLKLKNFKKDATLKLSKSTNQEWYEHVGPEVTRWQDSLR